MTSKIWKNADNEYSKQTSIMMKENEECSSVLIHNRIPKLVETRRQKLRMSSTSTQIQVCSNPRLHLIGWYVWRLSRIIASHVWNMDAIANATDRTIEMSPS